MNIYYFNVNYACNSNCIFCYSYNTKHVAKPYKEISSKEFIEYLKLKNIQSEDRVIINGGEPFIHSEITDILYSLLNIGCEVLIYTNGRNLCNFDFSFLTKNYRFVIPVHGHETLHDKITRCVGSFAEMQQGLNWLATFNCNVDMKVILNHQMIDTYEEFNDTLNTLDTLKFNNALHITKMADTVVSIKNGIPSVSNELASKYTRILFEHFKNKIPIIKIFDTCVKELKVPDFADIDLPIKVYFKDVKSEWQFQFYTPDDVCRKNCSCRDFCQSAVGNYTVLEYNGKFYKGIE